jgi:catechol 2,3-dioxygenase-like lactoylglutathione lyase family enzyme
MDYRIDHVGLLCRNLESALHVYRTSFGSQLVARWFRPGDCDFAEVGAGCDVTLQLSGAPFHDYEAAHIIRHGYSIDHVGFRALDVDAAYEELVSKGVGVVCPPTNLMGVRQCGLVDPDGLLFEIRSSLAPRTQMREAAPTTWSEPAFLRVHHVSILTHDLRRSQRFYENLLGLRTVYEYVENDGGFVFLVDSYYDRQQHSFMLEIIGPPDLEPREEVLLSARGPCYDHLCFVAEDVAAAWREALARGAVPVDEPAQAYGNWLAWLRDADGNDVEIMGPLSPEVISDALRTGVPFDSTGSRGLLPAPNGGSHGQDRG